jgi:hypothetical protein
MVIIVCRCACCLDDKVSTIIYAPLGEVQYVGKKNMVSKGV